MKKEITITILALILLLIIAIIFDWGRKDISFEANKAILFGTSTFSNNDMPIVINNIKDNQKVSSPIKITGKARGNWFFEASFPIKLIDVDENVLGTAIATADGDWMTTDFVNFTAELEYNKATSTDRALLILSNDNPSGKPELDKAVYIPVILK